MNQADPRIPERLRGLSEINQDGRKTANIYDVLRDFKNKGAVLLDFCRVLEEIFTYDFDNQPAGFDLRAYLETL
jgi:hypothetical protein